MTEIGEYTAWEEFSQATEAYHNNPTSENLIIAKEKFAVFQESYSEAGSIDDQTRERIAKESESRYRAQREERSRPYAELLRDPRWQRKRLEIMNRDNFCCQICDSSKHTLNVHHEYYEKGKLPWEYPDSALSTICEDCHKKEHGIKTPNRGKRAKRHW